jgi:hypothetical protein
MLAQLLEHGIDDARECVADIFTALKVLVRTTR